MTDQPELHNDMLLCPSGHTLIVLESRMRKVGYMNTLYRRRACPYCGYRHSTVEVPLDLAKEVLTDD